MSALLLRIVAALLDATRRIKDGARSLPLARLADSLPLRREVSGIPLRLDALERVGVEAAPCLGSPDVRPVMEEQRQRRQLRRRQLRRRGHARRGQAGQWPRRGSCFRARRASEKAREAICIPDHGRSPYRAYLGLFNVNERIQFLTVM